MKSRKLILLYGILGLFLLGSCDKSDDADGWVFDYEGPTFDTTTELGQIRKELYDTYQVNFTTEFDETFYLFDWTSKFNYYEKVDVAESDYAQTALFLQEVKNVLDRMPDFLINHLPSNILLVDSIKNGYDISDGNTLELIESPIHAIFGATLTNYIVLSFAGKSFASQDLDELKEAWVELFFERIFDEDDFSAPTEFQELVASQSYSRTITGYNITANSLYNMENFGFLEESYLRRTRIWYAYYYSSTGNTQYNYNTMRENMDMAAFVAFTMYCPTDKKAEIYAISDLFAQKEELMKKYCSETLGFELEYLGD